ncbi:MAG: hypothetical protein ACE5I1_32025, partial [bacterium]
MKARTACTISAAASISKRYHNGFDTAIRFLNISRKARDDELKEKEKQRAERERLLRERAEQQSRTLRLTSFFTAAIMILLVMVAIAGWMAWQKSIEAERHASEKNRQALKANYNLAKLYEVYATNELNKANVQNDSSAYKEAWLYLVAALEQEMKADSQFISPALISSLFLPE